jgi:hypothetical protein
MRARKRRGIEEQLRRHAELMREFEKVGMTPEDASSEAFLLLRLSASERPGLAGHAPGTQAWEFYD